MKCLTPKEILQLHLDAVHALAQHEDAIKRHANHANAVSRWPATERWIDEQADRTQPL